MVHYFTRLENQIDTNWNNLALCDYHGAEYTFKNVAEQIAKLHILFEQLGIKKGDKIAICGRNQAKWGIVFLAANTYEAIVVPILSDFPSDIVCKLVNHSDSVLLFTDEEIFNKLEMEMIPNIGNVIAISTLLPLWWKNEDTLLYELVEEKFASLYPWGFLPSDVKYPVDNDKNVAIINYTSGSTGEPKGVMIRYECISANIEYGQRREPSFSKDNLLSILPMAHMFGMMFELLYPLCGGTTIYYLGKAPTPSYLMDAMQIVKPYLFIAVPMVYEKIYQSKIKPILNKPIVSALTRIPCVRTLFYRKIRKNIDNSFGGKVRVYVMGGAPINPEIEEFFKKIKLHFTVGYGMTEAAPLIAYENWNKFVVKSSGKPIDSITLRVNSKFPNSITGEIQVKGFSLFSGYYKNEIATKNAFTKDGWFNTGDLGTIDKNGNVFIKGRCKTMLLSSNGQNIYPEEIESIINNIKYVLESLVVMRENHLVALVFYDVPAIKADGVNILDLMSNNLKFINKKVPTYSKILKIVPKDKPFEKTPKMSIKRYLYH